MDLQHFYRTTLSSLLVFGSLTLFVIAIIYPFWLKTSSNTDQFLSFTVTKYNDVEATVLADTLDAEKFEEQLINSLRLWKEQKIKAAMLAIPTSCNAYVPIAFKHGFNKIHHATPEKFALSRSVSGPQRFQAFPQTILSVATIVIHDGKILVVKDTYESQELGEVGYKLPGGYVDNGENISAAAIREIKEETGIDTEFESIITFRHSHNHWWGMESMSKLYFCCVLKPLSTAISYQSDEITEAKWMDFDEFKNRTKGVFAEFIQIFEQQNSLFIGSDQDVKKNGVFYEAKIRDECSLEEPKP